MKRIDPDLIIMGFVLNDFIIDNPNDENFIKGFDKNKFISDYYDNTFYRCLKKLFPNLYDKYIINMVENKSNTDSFNQTYGPRYGYSFDYKTKLYRSDKYLKLLEDEGIKYIS